MHRTCIMHLLSKARDWGIPVSAVCTRGMQTRGSKRTAAAPAAQVKAAGEPPAKRGRTPGSSGGAAAPRKAAGGSRAAAAQAAPGGPQLYAVRCKRTSRRLSWDPETFVDCYGDEDEEPAQEVEDCTEAGDGVWFHDAAYSKWQHPAVAGSGPRVVSTDGQGQLLVFGSLEAANERAGEVFADMLVSWVAVQLPSWMHASMCSMHSWLRASMCTGDLVHVEQLTGQANYKHDRLQLPPCTCT